MDQVSLHQQNNIFRPVSSFRKVMHLLDFVHGPKLKVLDVGCGPGYLGQVLEEFGHIYVGLDVNESVEFNGNLIKSDINLEWPVQASQFDLVICTDVPEHLYDPVHVLQESARVLKPDGKLIFGVPNHFDLRQRLRMLFGRGIVHWDAVRHGENAWDYSHIRFFNLRDLQSLFVHADWHVQKMQFNFMGGGIVPRRITPPFLRLALLATWPGLFSGKFIFLLGKEPTGGIKKIYLPGTPEGM